MKTLKKYLPDLIVLALFSIISFAYFFPADIEGRILYRHDSSAGKGLGHELTEYYEQTGEHSRWTNSAFGGMPTYQIAPSYSSTDGLNLAINTYHLWLPENVWLIFSYLLGFYILLRAFDFRQWMAALGAVIWAFSSYFLIIIAAGHLWKVMALAYLPPMIAGVVLAYRGKLLWGFILTAIFTAFEVKANHVQMTYYYLFIIAFLVIAFLVEAIRQKQQKRFLKATAVCLAGAAIGVAINLSNLYHTWQYQKESMRGKTELAKGQSADQTDSGLGREYITQWSYGIGETWTLLIPNTKGGASIPMSQNETAMAKANPEYAELYNQMGQYWGEQPGTSGPVYVGAFVLMLFVLGLFIVKGPVKWALLAATILSILLSWGHNFMPLTNFFIDNFPMYSKFRTVASILVIAEFTIPLLAMLALKKVVDEPELLTTKIKFVYASFGLTAGVCMLFAIAPTMFFSDFISSTEMKALAHFPSEVLNSLLPNIREMRQAMFTADCWRSFFIIVVGTLLLLLFKAKKLNATVMIFSMLALCLIDLWQIDKRYLNDDMFVSAAEREAPIEMTQTDEQILGDKTSMGNFRVLNFATNTFNENNTSYYHKSIGGYHPAKLRRYQELIESYIAPQMTVTAPAIADAMGDMTKLNGDSLFPVLNMLNTRYFILPLQGGQTAPIKNPYGYGNGWFVDKVKYVDNANSELDAIGKTMLRHEAVADKKFEQTLGQSKQQTGEATVTLTSYKPNHLTYDVKSSTGGIVVFSEVYYPGWTATIDGNPAEVGRVDYVLRGIQMPAGSHKVEMMFYPKSVDNTETVAYIAYLLLFATIAAGVFFEWKKRRAKEIKD
ncbi:YfhO family protein [Prevotella koreensis]|uniref:YfhO family protein n=1 Tax=Prevotella koreensis TaxID=2490854 RepID=UPI0028ED5BD1|nr:YfhO family protein [Prevotella koreensis]